VRRHHDGGFRYPPVVGETEVVELPPDYMSDSGGGSENNGRADRLRGGSSLSSPREEDDEDDGPQRHYALVSPRPSNSQRSEKSGFAY
jgi:hypothetical protein